MFVLPHRQMGSRPAVRSAMSAVSPVKGRKPEPSRQPWRGAVVCALNARQEIVARTQESPGRRSAGASLLVGV